MEEYTKEKAQVGAKIIHRLNSMHAKYGKEMCFAGTTEKEMCFAETYSLKKGLKVFEKKGMMPLMKR